MGGLQPQRQRSLNKMKASILEIQRMSTEDGPGLRTTVFFKGCSLHCSWCHNPESISPRAQVHWIENRCIGCRMCLEVCPEGALSFSEDGNKIDRTLCSGCGRCAEECPGAALELLGKQWELEELVAEVIKDAAYFEKSGGGVTLSGGEPTLQAPFAARLLQQLKNKRIHTALDTCGLCPWSALEALLPTVDLVLYDLKVMDPHLHQVHTGSGNEKILDNLMHLRDAMRSAGRPRQLWIRTPIIPGATDAVSNIRDIGRFVSTHLDGAVSRWELCAFNNLCRDKYRRLDRAWQFKDCPLLSRLSMEKMAAVARNSGVDPDIVHWSGSTLFEAGAKMNAA
jgi:pyruvate formate lyase activating enzyme